MMRLAVGRDYTEARQIADALPQRGLPIRLVTPTTHPGAIGGLAVVSVHYAPGLSLETLGGTLRRRIARGLELGRRL